jgi:ubiquinone/menaquinone biosynthesis C-methylase UbiE
MTHTSKILSEWEKFAGTNALKAIDSEATNSVEFWARGKKTATLILEDANLKESAKILDIGVGVGRVARFIAEKKYQVYGIDISPTMIELAREINRNFSNLEFTVNDGKSIPFPSNYFDLAYSVLVFQHLPEDIAKRYFLEVRRVLKPYVKLWLQVPRTPMAIRPHFLLVCLLPYVHRAFAKRRHKDLSFSRYYSVKEITRLLSCFNFKVIKVRRIMQNYGCMWLCITATKD